MSPGSRDKATVEFKLIQDAGYLPVATLTLTKAVTFEDVPVRMSQTYYIGLFDDEELTQLHYIKPITLTNASSRTTSLRINLYRLPSRSVTFYIAEVDKDGNPVKSGKKLGYKVSIDSKCVTLDAGHTSAEVTVTNKIVAGTKTEKAILGKDTSAAGSSSGTSSGTGGTGTAGLSDDDDDDDDDGGYSLGTLSLGSSGLSGSAGSFYSTGSYSAGSSGSSGSYSYDDDDDGSSGGSADNDGGHRCR